MKMKFTKKENNYLFIERNIKVLKEEALKNRMYELGNPILF